MGGGQLSPLSPLGTPLATTFSFENWSLYKSVESIKSFLALIDPKLIAFSATFNRLSPVSARVNFLEYLASSYTPDDSTLNRIASELSVSMEIN